MSECDRLSKCPFFNERLAAMPAMSSMIKRQYCSGEHADNEYCARLMVMTAKGTDAVPLDLFPADIPRAKQLIGE